jgi:DNA repair protein RadD
VTVTLRQYQQEAIDAIHNFICSQDGNPCISLPTGSGKSHVIAGLIRKWRADAPWMRVCVLAHRRELIQQNYDKLAAVYDGKIGIFSASIGRRDYDAPVLFAGIDSVSKRFGEFPPWDALIIDEAHHIPTSGDGVYRTWINGCKKFNPRMKVIGLTATPYRMSGGPICHKDHILTSLVYEANVADLIDQGFLCNLRSKVGVCQPDLKDVKRNSGGDYVTKSLSDATNRDSVVSSAVTEVVRIMVAEKRRAAIFFCVDIEHAKKVSAELQRHGVYAPYITGKTRQEDRDKLIRDFKERRIFALCNVGVFTEGFDAPHIDCIVLLRPTLSAGLFSQMVGRGLRLFDGKSYCLVLDLASCIDEHGPIDLLGSGQRVVMATCGQCRESFSRAIRTCPACGWDIPKQELERIEKVERERRMHGDKASSKSILSQEPETLKVDSVFVSRHCKEGSPDSLKVQYRCGLSMFREWVCLDHPGPAGSKSQSWWKQRMGGRDKVTVADALGDMFLSQSLLDWTKTISVRKNGKYFEVIDHNQPLILKE